LPKNEGVWLFLTSKPEMQASSPSNSGTFIWKQTLFRSDGWIIITFLIPLSGFLILKSQHLPFESPYSPSATKWLSSVEGSLKCKKCSQASTLARELFQPIPISSLDIKRLLSNRIVWYGNNGLFQSTTSPYGWRC
jgi:hypothetical protein